MQEEGPVHACSADDDTSPDDDIQGIQASCPVRALSADGDASASAIRNLQQYLCDASPAVDEKTKKEQRLCFAFFKTLLDAVIAHESDPTAEVFKVLDCPGKTVRSTFEFETRWQNQSTRAELEIGFAQLRVDNAQWQYGKGIWLPKLEHDKAWFGRLWGRIASPAADDGEDYELKMHQVLLDSIPLADLDDPKSLVHRLPRADKKHNTSTIAKDVKEASAWYKKEKRARAVRIRSARNFALVHKLLPGRLLFSDMQKTQLKLASNVPCVYWAHHLFTSMHKEGKATGLYRLYVLGQVNENVLALAAAESRLKIWGTDLFPAGSGEQVERPDNWGLTSLHRILGAADETDREYRGVLSEDGSALSKMTGSEAMEAGVEIPSSAVGTGTEGMYKHVMQAYQEELECGHRDSRHFRRPRQLFRQRDLTRGTQDLGTECGDGFRTPVPMVAGPKCRRQVQRLANPFKADCYSGADGEWERLLFRSAMFDVLVPCLVKRLGNYARLWCRVAASWAVCIDPHRAFCVPTPDDEDKGSTGEKQGTYKRLAKIIGVAAAGDICGARHMVTGDWVEGGGSVEKQALRRDLGVDISALPWKADGHHGRIWRCHSEIYAHVFSNARLLAHCHLHTHKPGRDSVMALLHMHEVLYRERCTCSDCRSSRHAALDLKRAAQHRAFLRAAAQRDAWEEEGDEGGAREREDGGEGGGREWEENTWEAEGVEVADCFEMAQEMARALQQKRKREKNSCQVSAHLRKKRQVFSFSQCCSGGAGRALGGGGIGKPWYIHSSWY